MTNRFPYYTATNSTITGSLGLGEHIAAPWTRLTGLIGLNTGSATFQYRMGPTSGTYITTSTFPVNSGSNVVDVLTYGRNINLAFTQSTSSQFSAVLWGQNQR